MPIDNKLESFLTFGQNLGDTFPALVYGQGIVGQRGQRAMDPFTAGDNLDVLFSPQNSLIDWRLRLRQVLHCPHRFGHEFHR